MAYVFDHYLVCDGIAGSSPALSRSVRWGKSVSELTAPKAPSWRAEWVSWPHFLTWSLVLIVAIGGPALVITRYIYWLHRPEVFLTNPPSISGTASRPPSSEFFMWAMVPIVACICIGWLLNLKMSLNRLRGLPASVSVRGPTNLIMAGCACGFAVAAFLVLVSIYPLTAGRDMHILASWGFYFGAVICLFVDYLFVFWWQRLSPESVGPVETSGLRNRGIALAGLIASSLFFLYMYLNYDNALPFDRYTKQLTYVGAEYTMVCFFFAYPLTGFVEMRRHYREVAPGIARR